jgi:predicted nicotinamide N-methyase
MQPKPPLASVLGVPVIVRSHPEVPEIPLFLASDGITLRDHVYAIQEAAHIPCWAFVWAAGALLARVLLDEPERVRGRDVVDFGAGSGIVAIAAAKAGARVVYAGDRDPDARAACVANASLASVSIIVTSEVPETFDVLCAADVLYASENAAVLTTFEAPGRVLLLADAYRDGHRGLGIEGEILREMRTFPDVDAPVDRAWLTVIDSQLRYAALRAHASGTNAP